MAILSSSKKEKFAQNVASGMSQADAYRDAYPSNRPRKDGTVRKSACLLAAEPEVAERIKELQAAAASAAVMQRQERMETLSAIARDETKPDKHRISAIDVLNKMDGAYNVKAETSTVEDRLAAMTDAIRAAISGTP